MKKVDFARKMDLALLILGACLFVVYHPKRKKAAEQ